MQLMPLSQHMKPGPRMGSINARVFLVVSSILLSACSGAETPARSPDPIQPPASSQEVPSSSFYSERDVIEIIVPFGEGGYADVTARLLADNLEPFIPGGAGIQVANITAGSGIVGANEFANERAADGLTLLMTRESTFIAQAFGSQAFGVGDEPVRYDVREWTPLFSVPAGAVTFVRMDTGITSALDLAGFGGRLRYGGTDPSDVSHLLQLLAFDLLGIDYDVSWGLSDVESRNAFRQGELDLRRTLRPAEVSTDGAEPVVLLFSLGQMTLDGIVRDPMYPDLPHLGEVYEQIHGVSPAQRSPDLWQHFLSLLRAQYAAKATVWVKNGAPADAVRDLQAAIAAMIQSEAFLSSWRESDSDPYEPVVDPVVLTDPAWAGSLVPAPATVEFVARYLADRSQADSR